MEASARARFGVRPTSALNNDEFATKIQGQRYSLYIGFSDVNSIGIKKS